MSTSSPLLRTPLCTAILALAATTFLQAQSPTITAQPQHAIKVLGGDVQFTATASVPGLNVVWRKGTAAVAGSAGVGDGNGSSTLNIQSLTTGSAGLYSARFTTAGGPLDSAPAYLGIIKSAPLLTNVKAGEGITLTCSATVPPGCKADFRWLDDNNGGGNIANSGNINGADTSTIKITNLTTALETGALTASGGYTPGNSALARLRCRVTMTLPATVGGTVNGLSITSEVNVLTAPRINPTWSLETVTVGTPVDRDLETQNLLGGVPYTFSATGLPPGVKVDPKTGYISGWPTAPRLDRYGAVIPYAVTFTIDSAFGKGTRTLNWLVNPLPPALIGSFTGLVERHDTLNSNLGGHCLITVSSTGGCTGQLILHGGMKLPITGSVETLSSNRWRIERELPLLKPATGTVRLTLENNGGTLTGDLTDWRFTSWSAADYVGNGTAGSGDGPKLAARLNVPEGMLLHPTLGLLIADRLNHRIVRVDGTNLVTFVGGTSGFMDGTGTAARLSSPARLAMHADGTIYVTDVNNHAVRKITSAGIVTTLAGNGTPGSANGTRAAARFNAPSGIALDPAGNVYVCDTDNFILRKITPAGVVTTLAGKTGAQAHVDGSGASARFIGCSGLTYEPISKCLHLCDGPTVRRVTLAGAVTTLVGLPTGGEENEGTYANTRLTSLFDITSDGAGDLYVCGLFNVYRLSGGIVHLCHRDTSAFIIFNGLVADGTQLFVGRSSGHRVIRLTMGAVARAQMVMHRAPYTKLAPPGPGYIGYHTAVIQNTIADPNLPAGDGYLTVTTSAAGIATWAGRHLDGTLLTGSGPLGVSGQITVHHPLAAGRGSIQGITAIDGITGLFAISSAFSSHQITLPPGASQLYSGAAQSLPVFVTGGRYPSIGTDVLALLGIQPGAGNTRLSIAKSDATGDVFHLDLSIIPGNALILPAAADNPKGVTLKLDAATGLFSGKYTLPATPTAVARTGTFAGVIVQGMGLGSGHHILADESAPGTPAAQVRTTSGYMSLGGIDN